MTDNNRNGLIIFCDGYSGSMSGLTEIPKGCLFLPAAGCRGVLDDHTSIKGVNIIYRDRAHSVRLVTDVTE